MATKKVYKKGEHVNNVYDISDNKNDFFIITIKNINKVVSYLDIRIMSLATILKLITSQDIYFAIVTEEQIIRKTKSKVIPKVKSEITNCKANLKDIYND